jgi:hypothetical protein
LVWALLWLCIIYYLHAYLIPVFLTSADVFHAFTCFKRYNSFDYSCFTIAYSGVEGLAEWRCRLYSFAHTIVSWDLKCITVLLKAHRIVMWHAVKIAMKWTFRDEIPSFHHSPSRGFCAEARADHHLDRSHSTQTQIQAW